MTIAEIRIKKMKTRWGSCKPDARRILLNLELAKKPISCLEYVLVHEMVHMTERHHTKRFRWRMGRADALVASVQRCVESGPVGARRLAILSR